MDEAKWVNSCNFLCFSYLFSFRGCSLTTLIDRMKSFFCLSLLLVSFTIAAQENATFSTNPTSLKWYHIETDHFRVLFPKGFEQQANRMANTFEHIHAPESKTLGVKPKKISIILQNQSSVSNAFVTLAPRRSEFYAMPSQNYNFLGTNDWLDLLASHEYRHVVQYQRSITGFNKLIYTLFGQQALSAMAFVNTPQWFWEGDAVATETAFTHSGRGRIPNFDLLFRTNFQEGRVFNYSKQYLRSYKHNIPDHYVLGYHMISYLRKKTGDPDIWGKISKRSWDVPFIPFRFSSSIRKETGLYVNDLFKEMAADLKKEWEQQSSQLKLTSFERLNPRTTKTYTDYLNPQVLEDGTVVAMKSGIGDIPQLVVLSENAKEKKIFTPGPINTSGMLSATNYRVVWNEYRFDPRWQVRTYSMIKAYDLEKGKGKTITKRSRFSAAALSPDGNHVATVETNTEYKTRLLILEYNTGLIEKQFENPTNDFISMPRFTDDGNSIVAIRTVGKEKTITRFDITTGKTEDLIPTTSENLGHPVPFQQFVLYNSPVSGIDNVYALDTKTNKRFQITSSKYGAYNPVVSKDGQTLYYNEQTKDGMDVVKISFDPFYWKPIEDVTNTGIAFYNHLVEQEGRPGLLDSVPTKTYIPRKYSKLKGVINPHSWGPYVNSDLTGINLGVISQDILSTTTISGGYSFDATERTGFWNGRVSYQALYPIIDFKYTNGKRSVKESDLPYKKVVGKDTVNAVADLNFQWKETTIEGGLRLPLVTTHSKYYSQINFFNYVGYTQTTDFTNGVDNGGRLFPQNFPQYFFRDYVANGSLLYNHFGLNGYRLLKQNRRDIYSKWGQSIYLNAYDTPYGGDYAGKQFSVYGIAYFPGLFKHHSFWGYWGYQKSEIPGVNLKTQAGLDNYTFRNQLPLPRGQSVSRFQEIYSMSANYTMPIWYPDIAVGPLVNFQRVRGNAFIDYAYGQSKSFGFSHTYTSIGGELKFDVNVMRFLPQLNFGFRYSYALETNTPKIEFILGSIGF
jgi:hypothetical protein